MDYINAYDKMIDLYDKQRELAKRMDRVEASIAATRDLAETGAGGVDALWDIFEAMLLGQVYATTTTGSHDAEG